MTDIKGSSIRLAVKPSLTWGTAISVGANDKMIVENLTHDPNPDVLQTTGIGSGLDMQNDAQEGARSPSIDIEHKSGYNDAGVALDAVFYNSASILSGAVTVGIHSLFYEAARINRFATVVFDGASAGKFFEYPSAMVMKRSIKAEKFPGYVTTNYSLLADQRLITGQTNTTTTLGNATVAQSTRMIARPADYLMINSSASALSSSTDKLAITSFNIEHNFPLESVQEMRGTAGNSIPRFTGNPPYSCTLTITLRSQDDFTYYTAEDAGTTYKAAIVITSAGFITGSIPYSRVYNFPKLIQVQSPKNPLTSPGENPLTLTFTCLVPSSIPTGMLNPYPHEIITNDRTTVYLP